MNMIINDTCYRWRSTGCHGSTSANTREGIVSEESEEREDNHQSSCSCVEAAERVDCRATVATRPRGG